MSQKPENQKNQPNKQKPPKPNKTRFSASGFYGFHTDHGPSLWDHRVAIWSCGSQMARRREGVLSPFRPKHSEMPPSEHVTFTRPAQAGQLSAVTRADNET